MERAAAQNPILPTLGVGIELTEPEREGAVAVIFENHHLAMVRLAMLLGADDPEDVVAEAFYQLYRRWRRLRSSDAAVAYLRSIVCNLTRMRIRHLQVVRKHIEETAQEEQSLPSVEVDAFLQADQRALVEAIKELPARQREALVLRHWLDLREADIAAAMGISAGAVKAHISRGMATLTSKLEERP